MLHTLGLQGQQRNPGAGGEGLRAACVKLIRAPQNCNKSLARPGRSEVVRTSGQSDVAGVAGVRLTDCGFVFFRQEVWV